MRPTHTYRTGMQGEADPHSRVSAETKDAVKLMMWPLLRSNRGQEQHNQHIQYSSRSSAASDVVEVKLLSSRVMLKQELISKNRTSEISFAF